MRDEGESRQEYRSPLREQRARDTRRSIVDAAQRLILERGYSATTMRDIAAEAGVAVQTIYSSIGAKRQLLSAFVDQMEDDARIDDAVSEFQSTDAPREHLRLRAYWSCRIYGTGIEMIEMLLRSQGSDPEIPEIIEEGDERHRHSVREWIVDRWDDDVIRP